MKRNSIISLPVFPKMGLQTKFPFLEGFSKMFVLGWDQLRMGGAQGNPHINLCWDYLLLKIESISIRSPFIHNCLFSTVLKNNFTQNTIGLVFKVLDGVLFDSTRVHCYFNNFAVIFI